MSYADQSVDGYQAVRGVSAEGYSLRQRAERYRLTHQPLAHVIALLQSCFDVGGHFDSMNELLTFVRCYDYYTVIANYVVIVSSRTEHEQSEVSVPYLNSCQQLNF